MWVSTFSLMTSQTLNLLFCFRVYHKINGILSKSVIFFFFSLLACRRSEEKKKERERERERLAGHRNLASRTHSGFRH